VTVWIGLFRLPVGFFLNLSSPSFCSLNHTRRRV
jgi:hypothetical protein